MAPENGNAPAAGTARGAEVAGLDKPRRKFTAASGLILLPGGYLAPDSRRPADDRELIAAVAEARAAGFDCSLEAQAANASGTGRRAEPAGPEVALMRAADIRPQPIRWLWPGYLAKGKLHILAGAPGTGKTTLALAMAATVSRGGRWPDGSGSRAGSVLIWSGEDDPSDTLVPRLAAAGADLRRVWFVGDTRDGAELRAFDPAADLALLELRAAEMGEVSLLVADPVVSAVAGDTHKNGEVRRALQPLVNLGARLGCAVLGISHFSKGTAGRDPTERVTGSVAFGALARVVLVAAKRADETEGPARLFARSKSNIGPDGGGFAYELEQVDADGITASRVVWGGPLEGSARELLGDAEATPDDSPRSEAVDWLADMLAAGPVAVTTLKREATAAGMSWRTVETAKRDLEAEAERVSEGNDGRGRWQWRMPGKTASARPHAFPVGVAVLPEASPDAGFSGSKTARPQGRREIDAVADLHSADRASSECEAEL